MTFGNRYTGLINKYRDHLPVSDDTRLISLGEGNTPLIHAPRLSEQLGVTLHLKFEGLNPTGSFKDRGMVMAVAKAVEDGATSLICASTGNTSASMAAYAARAGVKPLVLVPQGKIALGKLAQAVAYGAEIIAVRGNFDHALRLVRDIAEQEPIALVNSVNPYRLEGQKTGAFEVVDQLGKVPDILALPVGNAGNISAYHRGFREYRERGQTHSLPRLWGIQAAGAAPSMPLEAYAGTWRDPWYGDIVIEPKTEGRGRNRKSGLWLRFTHTPALQGWLEPYDGDPQHSTDSVARGTLG